MFAWELKLKVRLAACEGRLNDLRENHGNTVLERKGMPFKGASWNRRSDKLAWLRHLMRREFEEIRLVKQLMAVGPIVGNRMVLRVGGKEYPGPSIIELIQRKADECRKLAEECSDDSAVSTEQHFKAAGLDLALEIMFNPYRFLGEDERGAFREAEDAEDKIVSNRLGEDGRAHVSRPAGKPGPSLATLKAKNSDGPVVIRRHKE